MSKWTKEYTQAYQRAYREANKPKMRAYLKAYYQANKNSHKEYCKKRYELGKELWALNYQEHKVEILEQKRQVRLENLEKYKERDRADYKKHQEKRVLKSLQWAKNNPHKKAALVTKRHASKLNRTPKWLTAQDFAHIEAFYDAAKKLSKELGLRLEVDHIIPLQGKNVSGLHVPGNLQIITKRENCAKGNKYVAVSAA